MGQMGRTLITVTSRWNDLTLATKYYLNFQNVNKCHLQSQIEEFSPGKK